MLVTNNGVHYNAGRVYEVIDYVNWIKGIYHIINPKVTTAFLHPTRLHHMVISRSSESR